MSIITKVLKQTAVYWPCTGVDAYGVPTLDDPEEISCRWDYIIEEFITPEGTKDLSRAKVMVPKDVTLRGVLMLGSLGDITDAEYPKNNADAYEIRGFEKTPNFRATEFLRVAIL